MARLPLAQKVVKHWLGTAERGDFRGLKRMLAKEPRLLDALGHGPYWDGRARAMHYACNSGHLKIVRWLIARGASVQPRQGDLDWSPMHFAATAGRQAIVRLLREHGARIDVFSAVRLGQASAVRKLLRANPALIRARGPDGATPLHFAATPAMARLLLAAGADPNARDRFHHQSVAEWAIDYPAVVRVLERAGASLDIFLRCATGDLAGVKKLMQKHPRLVVARISSAKKTIGGKGETPLGMAARHGHRAVAQYLLAHGARATTIPSPLPGAVDSGNAGLVRLLLAHGADPNAFGPWGYAALHAAVARARTPLIPFLIAKGARLDLKDKQYHATPYGWAEHFFRKDAMALLKREANRVQR